MTVKKVILFKWNINIKFVSSEQDIIMLEEYRDNPKYLDILKEYLDRYFSLILTITVYKSELGDYIVEIMRNNSNFVRFFYSFFNSLEALFGAAEKLWQIRKEYILLYDTFAENKECISPHKKEGK